MSTDHEWKWALQELLNILAATTPKFREIEKNLSMTESEFVLIDHSDAYGYRKGSATHSSSSTSLPIPSIMLHHEWSLGKVLIMYKKYADAGDKYLGRVLPGFPLNHSTFDMLPPHLTVCFENQNIKSAMCIFFPKILEKFDGNATYQSCHMKVLLLRLLESFIHHSEF